MWGTVSSIYCNFWWFDNLGIDSGIKLIYLTPYLPDLNPIEECFSWVKHYIRRQGGEFRNIVETGNEDEPYLFLYDILDQVSVEASWGWFAHSGYLQKNRERDISVPDATEYSISLLELHSLWRPLHSSIQNFNVILTVLNS